MLHDFFLHDFLPFAGFHWLRPCWLLAAIPAFVLFFLLLRGKANGNRWLGVIDSELLEALLDKKPEKNRQWPMHALLCAWVSSAIALAGPSFEKVEQPVIKSADALVVLLDLSPSMLATDVKPSRVQAAHFKILDLLRERHEGYTALIAYSGSAHVVTPLSDDTNTIAALVNTLDPTIMPATGSRVEDAVTLAIQLLHNAHFKRGRLLLVTDGVVPAALDNIHRQLSGSSIELNVIGIGTTEGAPIPLPRGGFAKDSQGNVLMNPLEPETLKKLAADNGGYYSDLRTDDTDIAPLTVPPDWLLPDDARRNANRSIENWLDSGYWLIFPCLLIALVFFRRGVVVCVLPLALFLYQENVHAELPANWADWWQTPDQQAAEALKNGDTETAAKKFTNPQWKAYAEYQNGQHKEAAEHFSSGSDAASLYNKGNAQAKANDLQGAIDSYDEALKKNPDLKDAEFNRDLVKKLLEQQKQQDQDNQQQNRDDQQEQQDEQKEKDKQDQNNQQNSGNNQPGDSKDSAGNSPAQQDKKDQGSQQEPEENRQENNQQESNQQESDQQENDRQANPQQESSDQDSSHKDSDKPSEQEQTQSAVSTDDKNSQDKEKQQAIRQMLNVVPDDPGGLLRKKFDYYYELNRQQGSPVNNDGEKRL